MNDVTWLMKVLTDLREYARTNELRQLDGHLLDTAMIALAEIGGGPELAKNLNEICENDAKNASERDKSNLRIVARNEGSLKIKTAIKRMGRKSLTRLDDNRS